MKPAPSQREHARRRLNRWARRLGLRSVSWLPPANVPYPDYVICPHCGEPEVEVWCYEKTVRCHNCGQTFDHPLPPECQPECSRCDPVLTPKRG